MNKEANQVFLIHAHLNPNYTILPDINGLCACAHNSYPLTFLFKFFCPFFRAKPSRPLHHEPSSFSPRWDGGVGFRALSPRVAFHVPAAPEKATPRRIKCSRRIRALPGERLCNPTPAGSLERFPESERFLVSNAAEPAGQPQLRTHPPPALPAAEVRRSYSGSGAETPLGTHLRWLQHASLASALRVQQLDGRLAARALLVPGRLLSLSEWLSRGERAWEKRGWDVAGRNYPRQASAGWIGARARSEEPLRNSGANSTVARKAAGKSQSEQPESVPGGAGTARTKRQGVCRKQRAREPAQALPAAAECWVAVRGKSESKEFPKMRANPAGKAGCYSGAQSRAGAECEALIKLQLDEIPLVTPPHHPQ